MGNICCHAVYKFLSFHLLSKNLRIGIYETINLPVVLYGREIWSLTLSEEHRLIMFKNCALRRIFDRIGKNVRVKLLKVLLHNLCSS
jgi:hypothetical protein